MRVGGGGRIFSTCSTWEGHTRTGRDRLSAESSGWRTTRWKHKLPRSPLYSEMFWKDQSYFCCQMISAQLTCMATLSHLPPLDNSLIPSWSPPWFLWSWQPHKPDRDRLRRWVISGGRLQYFSPPPLSSWKGKDWNLVGFHFWKSLRQMTNIRLMGSRQTWKLTKFVKFLVWELSEAASYHFNPSNLSLDCKYVDDLRS